MQILAKSWALYEITGSAVGLGLNGLFRAIPDLLLGFYGGAIADRYDRKRIILFSEFMQTILASALAAIAFSGNLKAWHIYLFTVLNATVETAGSPARSALLPSLIPKAALSNAVTMHSILFRASSLIGPAIGGVVISATGIGGAFAANGCGYLLAALMFLFVKATSVGGIKQGRLTRGIFEGVTYIRSRPVICGALAVEAAVSFFAVNQVVLTVFAKDILQVGASGFGLMQSARGVGAVAGAVFLIFYGTFRNQGKSLYLFAILHALMFVVFAYSKAWHFSLFLLAAMGLIETVWGITRNIIFQHASTEGMRGRVMSVAHLTFRGLNHLGQAPAGYLISVFGGRWAVFLFGFVIAGTTAWTNYLYPELRRFVLDEKRPEGEPLTSEAASLDRGQGLDKDG